MDPQLWPEETLALQQQAGECGPPSHGEMASGLRTIPATVSADLLLPSIAGTNRQWSCCCAASP